MGDRRRLDRCSVALGRILASAFVAEVIQAQLHESPDVADCPTGVPRTNRRRYECQEDGINGNDGVDDAEKVSRLCGGVAVLWVMMKGNDIDIKVNIAHRNFTTSYHRADGRQTTQSNGAQTTTTMTTTTTTNDGQQKQRRDDGESESKRRTTNDERRTAKRRRRFESNERTNERTNERRSPPPNANTPKATHERTNAFSERRRRRRRRRRQRVRWLHCSLFLCRDCRCYRHGAWRGAWSVVVCRSVGVEWL